MHELEPVVGANCDLCARWRTEYVLDPGEDGGNGQPLLRLAPSTSDELKFTTIGTHLTHFEGGEWFESPGSDCRYFAAFAGSRKKEREERRNL
jgi:hypothetical protein